MKRETFWQLVRYGVNGLLVTALYSAVYLVLNRTAGIHPQLANLAGYLVAVGTGYILHSKVTFRDHGSRDRGTQVRFVVASLVSYAFNALWTWICTDVLRWPSWTPVVPISTLTPILLFAINRLWVFR
ncbi:GtrA family protein [uncultured Sphingomonas sp.]|uniref:GtrA family protein n=1 Tax=uncultured Sphingomonas sp. TaxID=158754 RepID=UPI0025E0D49A|nr:GtrA family protein [uncultured Sphingomonas sp.]